LDDKRRKLRQAISIALDFNEYLDIFSNGRGIMPNSPLPPGIFGYRGGEEGTNDYVHQWDPGRKAYRVRPIEDARKLMAEAGYSKGLDANGQPLTLTLDHPRGGDSKYKKNIQWYQKKLDLIGITLEDKGTDRKQMQERRQEGNWQISIGGWGADYPDPENFLFLYYGPSGQKKTNGMNRCNYESPEYDALFTKMERMSNCPERQAIINDLMKVWQNDAPSVLMTYPISFYLRHGWLQNVKLHDNSNNVIKYYRVDGKQRKEKQLAWNKPVYWPIIALFAILIALVLPAAVKAYRYERGL
jgi:ABC-type oligopeptide transport system substrate-binding subunit